MRKCDYLIGVIQVHRMKGKSDLPFLWEVRCTKHEGHHLPKVVAGVDHRTFSEARHEHIEGSLVVMDKRGR